jgi:Na+-transporting NADH:ubiquinone oxidoreductase subunit NqrC
MLDRILKAQSADVDGISGATVTSNAVKAAAADCFAQAGGASAEEAETETEAATENE